MFNTISPNSLLFTGRQKKAAVSPSKSQSSDEEIGDYIVVAQTEGKNPVRMTRASVSKLNTSSRVENGDFLSLSRPKKTKATVTEDVDMIDADEDPEAHLRATIPPMRPYALRIKKDYSGLISPEQFTLQALQHSPHFTYGMLMELTELDKPGRRAIQNLYAKVNKPSLTIKPQHQKLLIDHCLIRPDLQISPEIAEDIRKYVDIDDFSERITITQPRPGV